WIYTEFPLTGKDSLLPFIPVETMARAGGQPFDTLAEYKLGQYANGDFAGVSAITTFAPNIKTNLAYVILEDQLAGSDRGNPSLRTGRGEDYSVIFSTDITPFKGLDLKPLFSWLHADGRTASTSRQNAANPRTVGGSMNGAAAFCNTNTLTPTVTDFAPATTNAAGALVADTTSACSNGGDPTYHENRYTVGLDARWRIGAFGLDPTLYYQWGTFTTRGPRPAAPSAGSTVTCRPGSSTRSLATNWARCSSNFGGSTVLATRPGTTSPRANATISHSLLTEATTPAGQQSWPPAPTTSTADSFPCRGGSATTVTAAPDSA